VRQRRALLRGGEDRDVVPLREEVLREVADVELHPARYVEGVRADQADPHAALPVAMSSEKTRCIMCQSEGCSRSAVPRASAQDWVTCRTTSGPSPGGTGTASWTVTTMPQRRPTRSCRSVTGYSGSPV